MTSSIEIFGCGVQKAGTTSLFAYLCQHPALSPPSQKELHFFDDETKDWVAPDYGPLQDFFAVDDTSRIRFEFTPIYAFWPPAMARICAYNSAAKLVFLFRDPYERALSQWFMEIERGDEMLPFVEAIRDGRRRMDGLPPLAHQRRVFSYLERGLYGEQVRRALEVFPREQLLFLRSEDLRDNLQTTLAQIAAFAEIPAFPEIAAACLRPRPSVDALLSLSTEADLEFVAEFVREDLRAFTLLTGLDIADWPTAPYPS